MNEIQVYAVELTPRGSGAIAAILVAGAGASGILKRMTRSEKVEGLALGQTSRVTLYGGTGGEVIDDALLVRVGTERYELHVHGGRAGVAAVLRELGAGGAEVAPVERAAALGLFGEVLDGEVQIALARAITPTAVRLLLSQPAALGKYAGHWQARLKGLPTADALEGLRAAARELLTRAQVLERFLRPPRIAIVGAPNVGKSTLANALLGRRVSITSDLPGTTRDWVDARAIFAGGGTAGNPEGVQVEVVLVDTAGIRMTDDEIERESIERSHAQAAEADLVMVVFDGTRQPAEEEMTVLARLEERRRVVVVNKMDAGGKVPPGMVGAVRVAAMKGENLGALMQACMAHLGLLEIDPAEPFLFTQRQRDVAAWIADVKEIADGLRLLHELVGPKI